MVRCTAKHEGDRKEIAEFSRQSGLTPVLAEIVLNRCDFDLDKAHRFLSPRFQFLTPPDALPDIGLGVERTVRALRNRETIFVHGDYDVDGTVSVVLLTQALREMGAHAVLPFVPERRIDGYGLSRRGIEQAKAAGAHLLITCDCGITAVNEVEFACSLGLDVIVTDHHLPEPSLPRALAVVNPQREDSHYAFRGLCGAGVAFNFAIAVRAALRASGYFSQVGLAEPDLRRHLDLLALGILADAVPLLEDNRIFVSKGLKVLERTARPGLQALLETTALGGKELSSEDIAFKIVPRLNVAGRMGKAHLALELLLEEDLTRARARARELEELNLLRRQIGAKIQQEAHAQVRALAPTLPRALVLASESWHPGVLGIVAARISQAYHLPTAIISQMEEPGCGSVRGIAGVNLVEALNACREDLIRFGGHAQAAGLTISRARLDPFRDQFQKFLSQKFSQETFEPQMELDSEVQFDCLQEEFLEQKNLLHPFGTGNPEPLFATYQVEVCQARRVGEDHLKLRFRQGDFLQEGIGFHLGERLTSLSPKMDIAFYPRWNDYQGRRTIQLKIEDLR